MTKHDLDQIAAKLTARSIQKKEIALAKAQAEIHTVQREADAYWDGVYDALKAVRDLLPDTKEDTP